MFRTLKSLLGRPTARLNAPSKRRHRRRPAVEGLEGRSLMAAYLTANALMVDGTAGNDRITVGSLSISGVAYFEVNLNSRISRFRADRVPNQVVVVNGLAGNDTVRCLATRGYFNAFGGAGSDNITGGTGNDRISGGAAATGGWYYLASADNTFARADRYGQTDPFEDMATTWEAYFVNQYHGGAATLTSEKLIRNDPKWANLDSLFGALRSWS